MTSTPIVYNTLSNSQYLMLLEDVIIDEETVEINRIKYHTGTAKELPQLV